MGLDWNPGPRPAAGHEREFEQLWHELQSESCVRREEKAARFQEITVSAFETLGAPRVGIDEVATQWAHQVAFPRRVDKSLTEQVFVERMRGFCVLDLVPPCDGIPRYSNGSAGGYVEAYSFRGQFLTDAVEIIGEELLDSAYVSKLPEETVTYGNVLVEAAERYAARLSIDTGTIRLAEDPDAIEFRLDAVFCAGRWCRFWGARRHWLEACW
jgi:hypothetical protein